MIATPLYIEIPKHYVRDASEVIVQAAVSLDEQARDDLVDRAFWHSGRSWAVFPPSMPKEFVEFRMEPRPVYEMLNIADTFQDINSLMDDPDLTAEDKPTRRALDLALRTLWNAVGLSSWEVPRGHAVEDDRGIWVSWRVGQRSVGLVIHATDKSRDRVYFDDGANFRSEKPPNGRNLSLMLKNLTSQARDARAA